MEATTYRPQIRQADELPIVETRFETSSNWSGAYITANRDKQFMQIWGVWTIPDNLKLPPMPFRGPPSIPYVCSNWIGLDGQRLYFDSVLTADRHEFYAAAERRHRRPGLDAMVGARFCQQRAAAAQSRGCAGRSGAVGPDRDAIPRTSSLPWLI